MQSLLKIVPMRVDGEHGPVKLVWKACGCWFNFRAQRSHKCASHRNVQSDYILRQPVPRGGVAAD
jgi:hypothetical protein